MNDLEIDIQLEAGVNIVPANLQNKDFTPTRAGGEKITYDPGRYDGLDTVTMLPVPDSEFPLQKKKIIINEPTTITADQGYYGMQSIELDSDAFPKKLNQIVAQATETNSPIKKKYLSQNGQDLYYCGDDGTYHMDLLTKQVTRLNDNCQLEIVVEDSKNNLYVSTNNGNGLYWVNKGQSRRIHDWNRWSKLYEDCNGNVYIAALMTNRRVRLIYVNGGDDVIEIANTSSASGSPVGLFSDSKGNMYASNSANGLVLLNKGAAGIVLRPSEGRYYYDFFETSKGKVYAAGSNYGIIKLNGDKTPIVIQDSKKVNYFYESKDGKIFTTYSYSTTGSNGVYAINEETNEFVQVIDNTIESLKFFFEDSKGNTYVGGNSKSGQGLWKLNGFEPAAKIYDKGYNWEYGVEDAEGNCYLCTTYSTYNFTCYIVCIAVDGTVTDLDPTHKLARIEGHYSKDGMTYISGRSEDFGIRCLNGKGLLSAAENTVYKFSKGWKYFFEDEFGSLYVSQTQTPKKNDTIILKLEGKVAKTLLY